MQRDWHEHPWVSFLFLVRIPPGIATDKVVLEDDSNILYFNLGEVYLDLTVESSSKYLISKDL